MKRNIYNVISVIWSFLRLYALKLFLRDKLHFYCVERISPNVGLDFNKKATVKFGNKIRIHSGCRIKVRAEGTLEIQDGAKMNHNCIVACRDKIIIGAGTEFGPSVYLYDHDHIHDYSNGKNEGYNTDSIVIGKNCWIGANTVILKGTELGDNCVVAAGSVISGKYSSNTLVYQKRETSIRSLDDRGKNVND